MIRILLILAIAPLLFQCSSKNEERLFSIRGESETGIDFRNSIVSNDTFNALSFEYIYNGSGVGVGDFNNDGLEDVFFGGNQVSAELYLNKGNLKFEKVTAASGVHTNRWITGVSVIDINDDGWQDIYLSVGGKTDPANRRNVLFINKGLKNGVPVFEDQAREFGLDDPSYSTMAAFFDYDKDGDMDMYLVNNWLEQFNRNNIRPKRIKGEAESTDKLFRNNGDNTFTDVSSTAGILIEGYGLGVSISDINQDSWPDIYVSNDFLSNDLLWINNGDGTFTNRIGDYLKHQTHNGMGVDIADFNNDALGDIAVVDMLPPGHERQKLMTPGQNHDHFHLSIGMNYEPQYMRNTLQLNRGKGSNGNVVFSEIAFLSGVAQTDWSWAPLFADFDNDGWKDLFIANGYRKDVTHLDFIFFGFKNVTPFGTNETRKTITDNEFKKIKDVKLPNCFFRNTGNLRFEDKSASWCESVPTFTNGTAYADFDNDGDLDLITNNIDQEALLYENSASERHTNWLKLRSKENAMNEKIFVYTKEKLQLQEATPYRGFQSTVSKIVHFGLGTAETADSVIIQWPNGTASKFYDVKANTLLEYSNEGALPYRLPPPKSAMQKFQAEASPFPRHVETSPSDIKVTRTLMHELGRFGPCYAKGDVNHDGLHDFYFGREAGQEALVYIQKKDGSFVTKKLPLPADSEDGAAIFFDADGDGDDDLYVASACSSGFTEAGLHRLLFNDGVGNFILQEDALPQITTSSLSVSASDVDNDGDIDLFVGGHLRAHHYPEAANSIILINEGGRFRDATAEVFRDESPDGLVTSSLWIDINNDKMKDLIIAGEWMPITVYINDNGKLSDQTVEWGLADSHGWWNTLASIDADGDGYDDIVAGNTGNNSFFRPTIEHPLILAAADFDKNGSVDPILTYVNPVEKKRFIVHNRLVLIDQVPGLKRRMATFTQYATTPFEEVLTAEERSSALMLRANTLSSVVLRNNGGKQFTTHALPEIAQFSTINEIVVDDLNGDGINDLILAGNNYDQETLFGRYDASVGTVLLGDGRGGWITATHEESGLTADGDVRHAVSFNSAAGKKILVLRNNESALMFRVGGKESRSPFSLVANRAMPARR